MIVLSDILTQRRTQSTEEILSSMQGIHGALMKQISGISHEKNHRPFRDDDSLFSLPAFKECLVRQVRFVSVRLGQQVAGSVHGQHGRAAVYHFRAQSPS